jgi:DtxR family Mn-dependent transcriptional regulator
MSQTKKKQLSASLEDYLEAIYNLAGEDDGRISLTRGGISAAAEVAHKHDILRSFFVDVLGIDTKIAQKAACKSEHALGSETINRLLLFIEFVTDSNKNGFDLKAEFQKFCKSNSKR